jgi:hypothetical protein
MAAPAADYGRKFVRSNGWFAARSGAGQPFDAVNSRVRGAQRREPFIT